jgi:hypothetical protein
MGGRRRKPGKVKTRRHYAGRIAYTAQYLPGPDEGYLSAGTYDTYEAAEAAWIEQAEALRRGVHVGPRKSRTLFRDFALLWLELFVADRANTARGYEDALRVHLLPTFGHLRLQEITPETVARWIAGPRPARLPTQQHPHLEGARTLKGRLSGILTTGDLAVPVRPPLRRGESAEGEAASDTGVRTPGCRPAARGSAGAGLDDVGLAHRAQWIAAGRGQ